MVGTQKEVSTKEANLLACTIKKAKEPKLTEETMDEVLIEKDAEGVGKQFPQKWKRIWWSKMKELRQLMYMVRSKLSRYLDKMIRKCYIMKLLLVLMVLTLMEENIWKNRIWSSKMKGRMIGILLRISLKMSYQMILLV